MPEIYIVGLGIVNVDQITREAERAIRECHEVLYLDTGIATRQFLEGLCPRVTGLYETSYVEGAHRLEAYGHMAARVVDAALDHPPVAFAVQGHPVVGMQAPILIRDMAAALGLSVKVLPGISAMDCLFAELMIDPCLSGLQMYEATDLLLRRRPLQPDVPALIWQVGAIETRLHTMSRSRPERFERLRAHLVRFYPPTHVVSAVFAAPHPLMNSRIIPFALEAIGRHAAELHAGYTLYIPASGIRPIEDQELLSRIDSRQWLHQITRGVAGRD
jgi:hypothetical protein